MSDNTLNKHSSTITQPKSQGAGQAMLYGTGLTRDDMNKPQIGIASVWWEGNTCNMHLNDLAGHVKQGVVDAGLVGMRFNTIGVSDGTTNGTAGMAYSLQSRDIIADSIETVVSAQFYDALIAIPGCDKNMPGCVMAMARVNRPSIMVYGGSIKPGNHNGRKLDIISAFQAYGEYLVETITDDERQEIVEKSCPGAGACGGMYTANTMASAIEALGMSLPYSASAPAVDPEKVEECVRTGAAIKNLLELDLKPRDIMTREAFENAMVVIIALGGSTNAVLHLIAMARAVDIDLTVDDFQRVSDRVPFLADLKPSGKYVMHDLHTVGGTPAVMKFLLEEGLLNGECITCTGKTLAENLSDLPALTPGQDLIMPLSEPLKRTGHIQILKGNLAPGGSVAKVTGKEGEQFTGPARVFDGEQSMIDALEQGKIEKGNVIIIRYEGPKGGPGMPEMLKPTSAIMGAGLGEHVAMITDGRFSGGSHGFLVGHVVPEAQEGGNIALVEDGDIVVLDAVNNRIELDVSEEELDSRRQSWVAPELKFTRGTLGKYTRYVKNASMGCVTDE
ncbi:dihydroxy-acid dehydratase [Arenicella sp. 4NH20-0111]|uniref:dihydroxy-acid dehydratase n=1 Tax=Arenicella sp. 4NH20-0111 TaxID=3127648 RepID=UPI0031036BD0